MAGGWEGGDGRCWWRQAAEAGRQAGRQAGGRGMPWARWRQAPPARPAPTFLTSSALSSSLICPPVQSRHSTRNRSPSFTSATCGGSLRERRRGGEGWRGGRGERCGRGCRLCCVRQGMLHSRQLALVFAFRVQRKERLAVWQQAGVVPSATAALELRHCPAARRTAGISGCQRLCSGVSCSQAGLVWSTVMRGMGVRGAMAAGRRRSCNMHVRAGARRAAAAATA